MRYGFPKSPWAHPNGCPKFLVSFRCLTAPRPYMENGFYAMDPIRRVRPGLVPMPAGFSNVCDSSLLAAMLRRMMSHVPNTNHAVRKLLEHL